MPDIETIASELAAFADDDDEIALDTTGQFVLIRNGRDISGRFIFTENGDCRVQINGSEMSYRRFLTHVLGNLDVLAERIIAKRLAPDVFVDGTGILSSPQFELKVELASELLSEICTDGSGFATRIAFVTGDAGNGKTILLRELQFAQARAFLAGQSGFLLWHVDLQGRQLVRLSEALMGDLGDLRMTGLWMPAILRLIRCRAIVLAIDGFDELAAEQGSGDALGALAALVKQLEGQGVVVAASRRTFFDTEDYLKRSGLVVRRMESPCEFDQLSLLPWEREQSIELLSKMRGTNSTQTPEALYESALEALGGDQSHPMLTRPFLVYQLARALNEYRVEPAEFIRGMDDPLRGVAAVVEAFIAREVSEKWIHRETGQPYLTSEQHMEFLGHVAEEMYRSQRDRLKLDVINTIADVLMEEWEIPHESRIQALAMVRMHVLLTIPSNGDASERSFDHAEFRDYFVAYAIRRMLATAISDPNSRSLIAFLRVAQISDSTARYVCGMIELNRARAAELTRSLATIVRSEVISTNVPVNVGTILPFVLDGRNDTDDDIVFDAPAIFSSLAFENSILKNVTIVGSTFVNVSLTGVQWTNVTLERCILGELTLGSTSILASCALNECEIPGVRIVDEAGDQIREFAPARIKNALIRAGFGSQGDAVADYELDTEVDSEYTKVVRKVLRKFQSSTVISEEAFRRYFSHDHALILDDVIPLLTSHSVLEELQWTGSGRQRIWSLRIALEDVLAAEESTSRSSLHEFWMEVKTKAI